MVRNANCDILMFFFLIRFSPSVQRCHRRPQATCPPHNGNVRSKSAPTPPPPPPPLLPPLSLTPLPLTPLPLSPLPLLRGDFSVADGRTWLKTTQRGRKLSHFHPVRLLQLQCQRQQQQQQQQQSRRELCRLYPLFGMQKSELWGLMFCI